MKVLRTMQIDGRRYRLGTVSWSDRLCLDGPLLCGPITLSLPAYGKTDPGKLRVLVTTTVRGMLANRRRAAESVRHVLTKKE